MASAAQAMIAANTLTCTFPSRGSRRSFFLKRYQKPNHHLLTVRASSEDEDCNVEECAPEKEIGKVSVEWLAEEKTKVVGTFPPRNRGWTGYVEKDTAGQTNIYSVEPAVYVAESAISSGAAGSSSDGAENTAAIYAGIALVSVAAASSILLQVGKNSPPRVQAVEYNGPSLTYYINKFKPQEIIQASAPSESESSSSVQQETSDAPTTIQVESQLQLQPSSLDSSNVS
ncbi:protein MAINTENANCE OF PSII UNDER HIGH LIGHT 1 [Ziziphus jujuba]|uniref:Protein MAINTENANCE OF PSII UNDER HIGH LIGHT 1 n=1 Tax=Ziziphus jujuba TaxID=326968 RepID=A0A6P3ZRA1_ZIZJJ|nr:protein MAINTENANCE OF PSII UNDER HIGH LIGHT 1 [Ziziphus jujuba]